MGAQSLNPVRAAVPRRCTLAPCAASAAAPAYRVSRAAACCTRAACSTRPCASSSTSTSCPRCSRFSSGRSAAPTVNTAPCGNQRQRWANAAGKACTWRCKGKAESAPLAAWPAAATMPPRAECSSRKRAPAATSVTATPTQQSIVQPRGSGGQWHCRFRQRLQNCLVRALMGGVARCDIGRWRCGRANSMGGDHEDSQAAAHSAGGEVAEWRILGFHVFMVPKQNYRTIPKKRGQTDCPPPAVPGRCPQSSSKGGSAESPGHPRNERRPIPAFA